MTDPTFTPADVSELRERVSGVVLTPTDEGFAELVTGAQLAASYAPDAAIGVTSEDDVIEAVRFALDHGLQVHVQATGHGASGTILGGLLLITDLLDSVSVDPGMLRATIGAGARWEAVVAAAGEFGLAAITGSSTQVGAIGYTLGGGLGPLARSHGFSSDYARRFRVVTGLGDLVVADEQHHPDLFWALRGGKAGFGVVTSMEFELVALPEITGGALFFAAEHIETALRGWLDWTTDAPADATTSVAIVRFPPFEAVPEIFRGKTMLTLRFAHPDPQAGAALAEPLRALAPAVIDTIGAMPTTKVALIHNDPVDPAPSWVAGLMLTAEADNDPLASALLAAAGAGVQAPVVSLELRHLGNRTAVDVPEGSAVGGRSAEFTLGAVAILVPDLPVPVIEGFWAELRKALAPRISPVTTINFAGHPTPSEYPHSWEPQIFERLQRVAAEHDPAGVFAWSDRAG